MNNIILIGMPGAGKSTVGVILAKHCSMDFIDTDLLIQRRSGTSLQHILDKSGYLALRAIEEEVLVSLSVNHTVIATGGSAVYSAQGMEHLKNIGTIVYLKLPYTDIIGRIKNFSTRGIAAPPTQPFKSIFLERTRLYQQHAQITIDCRSKTAEAISVEILKKSTCCTPNTQ